MKQPWAFIRIPYMNPTVLGLYAQGFLIRFLHYTPACDLQGWFRGLGLRIWGFCLGFRNRYLEDHGT